VTTKLIYNSVPEKQKSSHK